MNATMTSADARALAAALDRNTRAMLIDKPQWYSLEDLMTRWSMGRENVLAQLKQHAGYVGQHGKPVKIHLRDVMKIDAILEEYRR